MSDCLNSRARFAKPLISFLLVFSFAVAAASPVERIHELHREIARHDDLYFREAAPEISDFEYDQLKAELLRLEELHPEIGADERIGIGDDRTGRFPTHRHLASMLSLDKALSAEDLARFHEKAVAALGREEIRYRIEPKLDGLAISLTYENGKLVRAATRGNGNEGDDVTENARTLAGVPVELRAAEEHPFPETIEIRGEVFLTFDRFGRLNEKQEAAGEALFANPRNLAAGSLRLGDPEEVAKRGLSVAFFGWGRIEPPELEPESISEFQKRLSAWGLPAVSHATEGVGFSELEAAVETLKTMRGDLPFPIDGAVVKVDSVADQARLGTRRTAPNWAVAVKFPSERGVTRLLGITLQVGRTGLVTPVAELEPVEIDGTTVSRTTLHNADEIRRRDLRIGDSVFVERTGDVIPAVVGVDLTQRSWETEPYRFPKACPECSTVLTEGETIHRCPNYSCPAQVKRRIEHFAAILRVRGFGPQTISLLVDQLGIQSPADLFSLQAEELAALPGLGTRSAKNLLAAIEDVREPEWATLLFALGIPGVGEQRARDLASAFSTLSGLTGATAEELRSRAGFGVETALRVTEFLQQSAVRNWISELEQKIRPRVPTEADGVFANEIVVLTGRFSQGTRSEIRARLIEAGARVTADVSRNTTLLIRGSNPGSRLERAHQLGVEVIGEEELLRRLEERE